MRKKKATTNVYTDERFVLRKIVDMLISSFNCDGVLKEIIKMSVEATNADSVFIYLLDEQGKNLFLSASKLAYRWELSRISLQVGEGLTGWSAKHLKTLAIGQEAYQDPRFKTFDVLSPDKYEAFLAIPLVHQQKLLGVINFQYRKANDHLEAVAESLKIFLAEISGVIYYARRMNVAMEKAIQFDRLAKVSQTITSEKYLDEILNLITVVTAEMFNSKICSIMLLDDKGVELSIKATQSLSEEYKRKPNLKVESSLIGQVVKTKKPLIVEDVRSEKRYFYREIATKEGLTSMLAVPMMMRDRVVGVINVYTKEPREFAEHEIGSLQMVANQAAVAVENTKWMEEALKAKEALEVRKLIERAKGVLMKTHHLTEEDAYRLIHKKSMDSCKTMKDIAESILLMVDFQKSLDKK